MPSFSSNEETEQETHLRIPLVWSGAKGFLGWDVVLGQRVARVVEVRICIT